MISYFNSLCPSCLPGRTPDRPQAPGDFSMLAISLSHSLYQSTTSPFPTSPFLTSPFLTSLPPPSLHPILSDPRLLLIPMKHLNQVSRVSSQSYHQHPSCISPYVLNRRSLWLDSIQSWMMFRIRSLLSKHRRQVLENIIRAGGVAGEGHLGGLGVTERFTQYFQICFFRNKSKSKQT